MPANMAPTLAITTVPALQPDAKIYYIMGANVAPLDTMANHGGKMLLKFIWRCAMHHMYQRSP